jgi:hypothetical protein
LYRITRMGIAHFPGLAYLRIISWHFLPLGIHRAVYLTA